ncbi:cytochrome P450 [Rickettsiella endosymbiont of Rhagonycha lignosa]|uniref:cytochrome P450 n=1 Tax=Rickettsiella endosymbiont of Rhagonycha lignosa TaxID=3077937 RepID=UPI00313E7700
MLDASKINLLKKNSTNSTIQADTHLPSTSEFFFQKIKYFYTNSPINFSFFTGYRYIGIPRLSGNPIVGRLKDFSSEEAAWNVIDQAARLATQHASGMCYFWIANKLILLITKPQHINECLIKNKDKVSPNREIITAVFGQNIATKDKVKWLEKRKLYKRYFSEKNYLKHSELYTLDLMDKFFHQIQSSGSYAEDIKLLLNDLSLLVILERLTNTSSDFAIKLDELSSCINEVAKHITHKNNFLITISKTFIYLYLNNKPPVDFNEIRLKFKSDLNRLFYPHLDRLRNTTNFLNLLWEAEADKNPFEFMEEVAADSGLSLLAARQGIATSLLFIIKLLAAHPEKEKKLRKAINESLGELDEISVENVNKIEYLDMVINESLRLYPTSRILLPRSVEDNFLIGGLPLFKGDQILISPYITHRLGHFFKQPVQFIPERFDKKNKDKIESGSYLPFGIGAHNCIGQKLSIQTIKLFLTSIYRKNHIEVMDNYFPTSIKENVVKTKFFTKIQLVSTNDCEQKNASKPHV